MAIQSLRSVVPRSIKVQTQHAPDHAPDFRLIRSYRQSVETPTGVTVTPVGDESPAFRALNRVLTLPPFPETTCKLSQRYPPPSSPSGDASHLGTCSSPSILLYSVNGIRIPNCRAKAVCSDVQGVPP